MSAKMLSGIRALVRQFLSDEFSQTEQDFQDDELDLYISHTLAEISQRRPYEVKETLTTTASSKELNISSIEDLLEVDKVEFRTGQEPPDYRNCSIFGNTLRMDITFLPGANENVYLYCHKLHQLTESTSTLSPQLEKVLIDGAVAQAALAWINQVRKQVAEGITRIADVNTSIDSMSARITQAMADLTSGRDLINKINIGGRPEDDYAVYASRELGNANSYLSQSQGYIRELQSRLSISGVINNYQVWANNKLAMYRVDLKRLTRPKTARTYPKD